MRNIYKHDLYPKWKDKRYEVLSFVTNINSVSTFVYSHLLDRIKDEENLADIINIYVKNRKSYYFTRKAYLLLDSFFLAINC